MTDKKWLPTGSHWGLRISRKVTDGGIMVGPYCNKMIWHTTEGSGIDGADSTLRGNGDEPHFLLDTHTGECIQYIALTQSAKALQHPSGTPETNRAGCIQVELVGFASQTPEWTDAQLRRIAALSVLVDHRVNIPRAAPVPFEVGHRFTAGGFPMTRGHFGHMHVPNNDHQDPGHINIKRMLTLMGTVERQYQ